jgi:hypothetical protein
MKAYKGFNSDLTCRGFKYEVGKEYEMSDPVEVCSRGFHACENPLDVFKYYPPVSDVGIPNRYCEVELGGDIKTDGDKSCASKIKIIAEISLAELIDAGVTSATISAATNTGNCSAATNTGYRSAATNTGNCSAATNTGASSAATNTGDFSAATNTGNCSAATNTGDRSAATNTGNCSAATSTGDFSAATNTGDRSAAINTGNFSTASVGGKHSVAIATGKSSSAKGNLGCWLVLTERNEFFEILSVKAVKVDGKKVKADTYYTLKNGKIIEAK